MTITTIPTVFPNPPFLVSPALPEVGTSSKAYVDDKIATETYLLGRHKKDEVDITTYENFIVSLNTTIGEFNTVVNDFNPKLTIVADNIDDITIVSDNISDISLVATNISDISNVSDNMEDINSCVTNMQDIKDAKLRAWEAEAEKLTANSYALEPEDTFVKIHTSNGDGTFTATDTTDYSAFHWKMKAQALQGQVQSDLSVTDTTDVAFVKGKKVINQEKFIESGIFTQSGTSIEVLFNAPFTKKESTSKILIESTIYISIGNENNGTHLQVNIMKGTTFIDSYNFMRFDMGTDNVTTINISTIINNISALDSSTYSIQLRNKDVNINRPATNYSPLYWKLNSVMTITEVL